MHQSNQALQQQVDELLRRIPTISNQGGSSILGGSRSENGNDKAKSSHSSRTLENSVQKFLFHRMIGEDT